jgi:DNA-binding IclR family transcriptional regulator
VVRERGWAEACGERETDLHAVAVPILDTRGALVAVLGVQGPAGRFGAPAMQRAVGHLREHAAALTALT